MVLCVGAELTSLPLPRIHNCLHDFPSFREENERIYIRRDGKLGGDRIHYKKIRCRRKRKARSCNGNVGEDQKAQPDMRSDCGLHVMGAMASAGFKLERCDKLQFASYARAVLRMELQGGITSGPGSGSPPAVVKAFQLSRTAHANAAEKTAGGAQC